MKGVENGVGVLVPSLQCPRCMKYDYTGRETGTGSHPASKEICYDGAALGSYTTYKVETCKSSGSVNELVCEDIDSGGGNCPACGLPCGGNPVCTGGVCSGECVPGDPL
ncbi:MAG: hypothetical protein ABIH80_05420 [Methanobacteriota archaeon]